MGREHTAIKRRITDFEVAEALSRKQLIQAARAGDRDALLLLRARYHLRLPLLEDVLNGTPSRVN